MSIKSPLQALQHIRALIVAAPTRTHTTVYHDVLAAANDGIAHAVPMPQVSSKCARDLVPGDVLPFLDRRMVVLYARGSGDGVEITLGALGIFGEANTVGTYPPDSKFKVEPRAELTPVQAAADKLLDVVREAAGMNPEDKGDCAEVRIVAAALLDELDPPKPPTLEEALDILRKLEADQWTEAGERHKIMMAARALLARVPN